jgi:hypothetical protein
VMEVLKRVADGFPVIPLAFAAPETPPEVAALIEELMAFDPETRLSDPAVSERRFVEFLEARGGETKRSETGEGSSVGG